MAALEDENSAIEQVRLRRLIKALDAARGHGTSAITLVLKAKQDINLTNKMLNEEAHTASCIKSRVNRLSVQAAITSTQERLRSYNRTPENGLIIYCGEVLCENGKERKVTIDYVPFKPISRSMYLCDNKFHTEPLQQLLEDHVKYGFIVLDGHGCLFGTVQGNHREVLHRFSVTLPNKQSRGGQSALRFARLRLEKRHNYKRKVGELATQLFIPSGERPNVTGLVVAGSAELKQDLNNSDLFDARLKAIVIPPLLDISYGGEAGFQQAIELSSGTLKDLKFVQEKHLVAKFFDEVARDSGRYCFGIQHTMQALQEGACESLIVWENLELNRVVIQNPHSGKKEVHMCTPEEEKNPELLVSKETGEDLEKVETEPFLDWILTNYKDFKTRLDVISDRSQEGNQFCRGFGGIGCIMRYALQLEVFEEHDETADVDSDSDFA